MSLNVQDVLCDKPRLSAVRAPFVGGNQGGDEGMKNDER